MASNKRSNRGKSQQEQPIAPPSTKEPPAVRFFPAQPQDLPRGMSVDDLRRSTAEASWSVSEYLDGSAPLPFYPLGGSVEGLSVSESDRRIDWAEIFSIPPRNPYLLKRALELRLLPDDRFALLPDWLKGEEPVDLQHMAEWVPPEYPNRKAKGPSANKAPKKRRKP